MALKGLKIMKSIKIIDVSKNKYWKPCFLVENGLGMSFIHLLKIELLFYAKNAKPQYANEIKDQYFKKQPM